MVYTGTAQGDPLVVLLSSAVYFLCLLRALLIIQGLCGYVGVYISFSQGRTCISMYIQGLVPTRAHTHTGRIPTRAAYPHGPHTHKYAYPQVRIPTRAHTHTDLYPHERYFPSMDVCVRSCVVTVASSNTAHSCRGSGLARRGERTRREKGDQLGSWVVLAYCTRGRGIGGGGGRRGGRAWAGRWAKRGRANREGRMGGSCKGCGRVPVLL